MHKCNKCDKCDNRDNCDNIKEKDTDKEKLPVFVISRYLWRTSVTLALTLTLVSACTSTPHNFTPTPTTHNITPKLQPLTLTQISSDPYTNKSSQHKTEVEPGTFAFGNTIVAAFKAGRFFKGGASNISWATSINGGQTWMHGFLTGTTVYAGGPYDQVEERSTKPCLP